MNINNMNMVCIIGRGSWANRLLARFVAEGRSVTLLNPREEIIDVSAYEEVIVCVPAYCVDEVLEKVHWGEGKKIVTSCVKGLANTGETVCSYLNRKLKDFLHAPVNFLGGANINDGREIVEISQDYQLELACILKNVYAVGFGSALNQGENFASHELAQYLIEYKKLGIAEKYWADLLVTCYSDKSRNKTFGRKFSAQEQYDEKTIEGLNTAKIIEKHDLFSDLEKLRAITRNIWAKRE